MHARVCVSVCLCCDVSASGSVYQGLAPSRLFGVEVDEVNTQRSSAAAEAELQLKPSDLLLLTSHTVACKMHLSLLCVCVFERERIPTINPGSYISRDEAALMTLFNFFIQYEMK